MSRLKPTLKRQRGRVRSRTRDEKRNATSVGEVIELTLQRDGSVTGRLLGNLGSPKKERIGENDTELFGSELMSDPIAIQWYAPTTSVPSGQENVVQLLRSWKITLEPFGISSITTMHRFLCVHPFLFRIT